MKWMLLLLLALPTTQSTAQNASKQFEWVKLAPEKMPVKSSQPYYDIDVPMDDEGATYTREQMDENASYYFNSVFNTTMVKNDGKHSFSGIGTYSFSIAKSANPEDIYTVTYVLDITTKKDKYNLSMHNFTLSHLDVNIDIAKRIDAAGKTDLTAKKIVACMHQNNMAELKKAYNTMLKTGAATAATASK